MIGCLYISLHYYRICNEYCIALYCTFPPFIFYSNSGFRFSPYSITLIWTISRLNILYLFTFEYFTAKTFFFLILSYRNVCSIATSEAGSFLALRRICLMCSTVVSSLYAAEIEPVTTYFMKNSVAKYSVHRIYIAALLFRSLQ